MKTPGAPFGLVAIEGVGGKNGRRALWYIYPPPDFFENIDMGVNLHICTRNGVDAPIGWDRFRYAGDKQVALALGKEIKTDYEYDATFGEGFYRPDPSSLREFCKRFDFNQARWEMLAWIFEHRPDLWLRTAW